MTEPHINPGNLQEIDYQAVQDKIKEKMKTFQMEEVKIDVARAMYENEVVETDFHHNTEIYQICKKTCEIVDQVILKMITNWSAYTRYSHPLNVIQHIRLNQPVVTELFQKCMVQTEGAIFAKAKTEEHLDEINNTSADMEIKAFIEGKRIIDLKMELLTRMYLELYDEKAAEEVGLEFEREEAPPIDASIEYEELTENTFLEIAAAVEGDPNTRWLVNEEDWENYPNKPSDGIMFGYPVHASSDHQKNVLIFRSIEDGQE